MTVEEKRGNEIQEAACKKGPPAPPTWPAEGNVDIESRLKPFRVSIHCPLGSWLHRREKGFCLNLNRICNTCKTRDQSFLSKNARQRHVIRTGRQTIEKGFERALPLNRHQTLCLECLEAACEHLCFPLASKAQRSPHDHYCTTVRQVGHYCTERRGYDWPTTWSSVTTVC